MWTAGETTIKQWSVLSRTCSAVKVLESSMGQQTAGSCSRIIRVTECFPHGPGRPVLEMETPPGRPSTQPPSSKHALRTHGYLSPAGNTSSPCLPKGETQEPDLTLTHFVRDNWFWLVFHTHSRLELYFQVFFLKTERRLTSHRKTNALKSIRGELEPR